MIKTVIWFCKECGHREVWDKDEYKYVTCPYCIEPMVIEKEVKGDGTD